jgi:hypothetical protein
MPDPSAVTRSSLPNLSAIVVPLTMSELPTRIWSDAEWARIRLGHEAQDMDEKWNVFVEGRTLFAIRSWTGHGVFEASFVRVDGGWRIGAAVVESDASRFRRTNARCDRLVLEMVISAIVLGERADELWYEVAAARSED